MVVCSAPSRGIELLGNVHDVTDEELMLAYAHGDEHAFRSLFARTCPILLGVARKQGLSDQEAWDVVQQTFLALHQARFHYREGERVRPWLFTIGLNFLRQFQRKRNGSRETSFEFEPSSRPSLDPLLIRERMENSARVLAAIGSLPPAQQEVVRLHWLEGQNFAEVASLLHVSVAAVKVRAHRAYDRLRQMLRSSALDGDQGFFEKKR